MIIIIFLIEFLFPDELFNNNRIYKEMFSIEYIR